MKKNDARMRRDRAELLKALSFCVGYLEDSFAGTPQGDPKWLKRYRALITRMERSADEKR